ncbi:MAG: DMT family transporter [Neisseriaceae bacterium]|nr:DMT family transporter [Neisseriaceae bacterium]
MTNQHQAYLATSIQMLIIGLSFMFVKISLVDAPVPDVLAHRFSVAFVAANGLLWLQKKPLPLSWASLRSVGLLVLLNPVLFFGFQALGLSLLSSVQAGIVFATVPVFVLLLAALLLGERTTMAQRVCVLLAMSGVVWVSLWGGLASGFDLGGGGFILLSALSLALFTVLTRKVRHDHDVYQLTYLMTFAGCVGFNLVALGQHVYHGNVAAFWAPWTRPAFAWSMLYLGILSSLLTSLLSVFALSKIEASKIGVFNHLTVIITVAAGAIFLHEPIYGYHFVGMGMILIGVFGSQYFAPKTLAP